MEIAAISFFDQRLWHDNENANRYWFSHLFSSTFDNKKQTSSIDCDCPSFGDQVSSFVSSLDQCFLGWLIAFFGFSMSQVSMCDNFNRFFNSSPGLVFSGVSGWEMRTRIVRSTHRSTLMSLKEYVVLKYFEPFAGTHFSQLLTNSNKSNKITTGCIFQEFPTANK